MSSKTNKNKIEIKIKKIFDNNVYYHSGVLIVLCSPIHEYIFQNKLVYVKGVWSLVCDLADVITPAVTVRAAGCSAGG